MLNLSHVFGANNHKLLLRCGILENVAVRRNFQHPVEQENNRIKVAVVGSGASGEPSALIVKSCDNIIHLYNCGEGTFRLMFRAFRFSRISNVFCTSNRWERVGGIHSLARAVFDGTSAYPTFHGPPEIEKCLPKFVSLSGLDPKFAVTYKQFFPSPCFEDFYYKVNTVQLKRANAAGETVMAYICRLRPRKGKFSLEKFTAHNLPVEHLKTIVDGNDITLDDGRIIYAKDYLSPGFPGASFLVIDVPSSDYLPDLERNELLNAHIDEISSSTGMEFVAHFSPSHVVQTPEYQQFSRGVQAKRHLAINDTNQFSGLKHVHLMQHTLNKLDPEIYPHLCSKFCGKKQVFSHLDEILPSDPTYMEPTTSGTQYIFSLTGKIQANVFNVDEDETESSDEECESDEKTTPTTTTASTSAERANAFPKTIFLGTGASFPNVTKSVTSILVRINTETSILLDCGEGSVGQLYRFYGDQTEDIIRSIKALHITHMHRDHHMGIMDFIRLRQKCMPENRPPLLLMAPKQLFEELLSFYEKHFKNVQNEFNLIDNADLVNGVSDDIKATLNVNDLRTCLVEHIEQSYAICLKMNILPATTNEQQQQQQQLDEFKLTFSGDTMPCDSLVELGRNSTLLIHEATFEDTLAASAAFKRHSTISQAIEQSEKMQAKYTLLTHFSQRYPVLPPINDDLIKNKNIGIALDFMEIIPDDLTKLNDLYFRLKETYAEELEVVERHSMRHARKNQLSMV